MMLQKDTIMFQNNWNKLVQDGFNVIFSYMKNINNITPYQMNKEDALKQYALVYEILMSRNPEIRKLCTVNLENQLRKYCEEITSESNNKITLEYFISKWISYSRILYDWIRKAFKYLDNVKRMINRGATLKEDVFNIFKESVYEKNKDSLYQEFELIINNYRNNQQINIELCKEYVQFLKNFKQNELIGKFLSSTEIYFDNLVKEHINSTFTTYMDYFWGEIKKEEKLLNEVFPEEKKEAINLIYEVLYYKNFSKLLSKPDGFLYMLNNYINSKDNINNIQDKNMLEKLKYTFEIFVNNENSFSMMTKLFKDFIKNNFKEKIIIREGLDKENPLIINLRDVLLKTNIIETYLIYQRNINDIINYCFSNNNIMNVIFKDGLVDIQSTQDKANMTYILPYYFDEILTKVVNEEERKKLISKGLEIFNYVPDKDIFVEIYRDLLSKRIISLYNKNYTDDKIHNFYLTDENYIIKAFTDECGNDYSMKISNIISDYILNENELSIKYVNFINEEKTIFSNIEPNIENKNNDNTSKKENHNINKNDVKYLLNIESNIRIFSSENWPTNFNIRTAILTPSLSSISNEISKFYHKLYPGRILKFSLLNSYILLNANFSKILNINTNFDIKCTTFQSIILLKFNEIYNKFNNKIKKEDLVNSLQFESNEDFIKAITPFIQSKLICEENDYYSLNNKLNIQNGQCLVFNVMEDSEIKKKEKVEVDRTYPVDGTIVKTVKNEKLISHKNLILKVMGALSNFSIKEEFIEKRISSLLEREIIFKDKKVENSYVYNEQ